MSMNKSIRDEKEKEFLLALQSIPIDTVILSSKAATSKTSKLSGETEPHIVYNQEAVGNLRRCIVDIKDSLVVAHFDLILNTVAYFTEPVQLMNTRQVGRLDFKWLAISLYLCISILLLPYFLFSGALELDSSALFFIYRIP